MHLSSPLKSIAFVCPTCYAIDREARLRHALGIKRAKSMTTSGNLTVTAYDQITLLEQAVRRAGKEIGGISAEDMLSLQLELSMFLNAMINKGTPLFTVDKQIYGMNLNQNILQFTPDTISLINVLYRYNNLPEGGIPAASSGIAVNAFDQNLATACVQTAPNGNISYDFTDQTVVTTVGLLMNGTANLNPVYEYSNDGISWIEVIGPASAATTYTAGQWYWQDVSYPQSGLYFRVRETSGGTLNVTEVVFGTSANEILLSPMNQDDYQNLPFKNQTGRPLQYWLDRQIIPQAWFWPASQYSFNSIVVWRKRIIQNVGAFTNQIEMPNRMLDYVISGIALRALKILPSTDMSRLPMLQADFALAESLAWSEERASGPLFYSPMISGYTGYSGGGGYGSYGGNC